MTPQKVRRPYCQHRTQTSAQGQKCPAEDDRASHATPLHGAPPPPPQHSSKCAVLARRQGPPTRPKQMSPQGASRTRYLEQVALQEVP